MLEHCEPKHKKNIALAMLGDTRSPLAYRSRGVWLLCSFQGPSEKGRRRHAATRGGTRAHGLSKLNSMLAPSGTVCPAGEVQDSVDMLGRSGVADRSTSACCVLESSKLEQKRRLARIRSGSH